MKWTRHGGGGEGFISEICEWFASGDMKFWGIGTSCTCFGLADRGLGLRSSGGG